MTAFYLRPKLMIALNVSGHRGRPERALPVLQTVEDDPARACIRNVMMLRRRRAIALQVLVMQSFKTAGRAEPKLQPDVNISQRLHTYFSRIFDTKGSWWFSTLPKVPHCGVSGLDVVAKPIRVE
jgi:hypothetical protein